MFEIVEEIKFALLSCWFTDRALLLLVMVSIEQGGVEHKHLHWNG